MENLTAPQMLVVLAKETDRLKYKRQPLSIKHKKQNRLKFLASKINLSFEGLERKLD